MPPFSAAERHKNVATAEGRGKHLSRKPNFLVAARCRACIRSRSLPRQGRKTVALEKSFAPAGAWLSANGNHGLRPWLYSDAAPRLLSSHPELLALRNI
ncbi:MAG: hypothetical protein DMG13_25750 [Acidobacteria bacterium]|nr:MAG: hypothetical protein DMG13_25750 [Acidobacteriota bacterium]